MVAIVERKAVCNWFIEDQEGNRQDVIAGKEYTTTRAVHDDGTVTLFSSYWVRVPISVFGGNACEHCGTPLPTEGKNDGR
jgi:hypothetical protein